MVWRGGTHKVSQDANSIGFQLNNVVVCQQATDFIAAAAGKSPGGEYFAWMNGAGSADVDQQFFEADLHA